MRTVSLAINRRPATKSLRAPGVAAVGVFSLLAVLSFLRLGGASALAQTIWYYCPCPPSTTLPPPFFQILNGGTPYIKPTGTNCPWMHPTSTMVPGQGWGVVFSPGTAAAAVYEVDITQSGDASQDIIFGVASTNCDIGGVYGATAADGWTNTTTFQLAHSHGMWGRVCYLTNRTGVAEPEIEFHYLSGTDGHTYIDCLRFVQIQPCLTVASPTVTGPLATNVSYVTVTGVSINATMVTVYQDSGSGMTSIGTTNLTSPDVTVVVRVSGLVAGAQAGATQTIGGQESCVPTAGTLVGIGPNSSLRVALSLRGNPNLAGPVWTTGGGTNLNVYFLGASTLLGGAPEDAMAVYPSNNWQTITLQRGPDSLNPINPTVLWNNGNNATPDLEGDYGALDGIAFACNGDPGYYDIYIDDIANGTNGVLEKFEGDTLGATIGFSQPSFSGTTSAFLLGAPNSTTISGNAATSGTNSTRVQWQFISNATNQWLRLVYSGNTGVANPQVNLNEPISFRLLMLRPGDSLPALPAAPVHITGITNTSLSYSGGGGSQFVLLRSATANCSLSGWFRTATNTATPASFTIPAVGTSSQVFYSIKSE
ncbi:MAG: hypothetical protein ABSD29_12605 [Verrucomicrobiota bacterium]|jgi:hypothetical protein